MNKRMTSGADNSTAGGSDAVPLDLLRRTRDGLEQAMGYSGRAEMPLLEVLRDLSDECRRRGGTSEPDSLSGLLFRWRRRQAQREAALAVVRRERTSNKEASA